MIQKIEMRESRKTKAKSIKTREFLRMCGILVNYKDELEETDEICLEVYTDNIGVEEIVLKDVSKLEFEKILEVVLEQFEKQGVLRDQYCEKEIFTRIKDIYIKHQLALHIYNIYHFHKINRVLEDSCCALFDAYVDLFKLKKDYEQTENVNLYHVVYAKVQCGKRVNETCHLMNKKKTFRTQTLAEELKVELEKAKVKVCGYYLLGQLYFVDSQNRFLSNKFFNNARECGMTGYFESNMYYYMGVNSQYINQELDEETIIYHKESLKKNKKCYRSMYKIGMYHTNQGQDAEAKELFEKIIECFQGDLAYLQPLERVYLFKAYERIAKCMMGMNRPRSEIEFYEKKAKAILNSDYIGMAFLRDYYQEEKEQYQKYIFESIKALSILNL